MVKVIFNAAGISEFSIYISSVSILRFFRWSYLPEVENYQVKIREQSVERKKARKASKNYDQYLFLGNSYGKGRLVLAVVKQYVFDKNPKSLSELELAFPEEKLGKIFTTYSDAQNIFDNTGQKRHFIEKDELIDLSNESEQYAVSNQWNKYNIQQFLDQAKQLEYKIKPIKKEKYS